MSTFRSALGMFSVTSGVMTSMQNFPFRRGLFGFVILVDGIMALANPGLASAGSFAYVELKDQACLNEVHQVVNRIDMDRNSGLRNDRIWYEPFKENRKTLQRLLPPIAGREGVLWLYFERSETHERVYQSKGFLFQNPQQSRRLARRIFSRCKSIGTVIFSNEYATFAWLIYPGSRLVQARCKDRIMASNFGTGWNDVVCLQSE